MMMRLAYKILVTTALLLTCIIQRGLVGSQNDTESKNCENQDDPYVYGNDSLKKPFGEFDSLLTKECGMVKRTVDWPSGDIKDNPDIVSTPGECCKLCIDNDDCQAWVFRACCNHCWIKHTIHEERPCDGVDCIGGIKNGTEPPNEKSCTPNSVVPEKKPNDATDELDHLGAAVFACKAVEGLKDTNECPDISQEHTEETDCSRKAYETAQNIPQCESFRRLKNNRRNASRCINRTWGPESLFHYYARLVCGDNST